MTLLWALANANMPDTQSFIAVRNYLVQYTGVIGIGVMSVAMLLAIQQFLGEQRGAAEFIGEWALYAAVLLIALALIKRFPYRLFVKTHKLIAIVYVTLVLHAVVLMDFFAARRVLDRRCART